MMTGIAHRIPGYTMLAYMNGLSRGSLVNACEDLTTTQIERLPFSDLDRCYGKGGCHHYALIE